MTYDGKFHISVSSSVNGDEQRNEFIRRIAGASTLAITEATSTESLSSNRFDAEESSVSTRPISAESPKHSIKIGNPDNTKRTGLNELRKDLYKADAFVFTRNPDVSAFFRFISAYVGLTTHDSDLHSSHEDANLRRGKPVIIFQDTSWEKIRALIDEKIAAGTVKPWPEEIGFVSGIEDAISKLKIAEAESEEKHSYTAVKSEHPGKRTFSSRPSTRPDYNVAVYCSAYTNRPEFLNQATELGNKIAVNGWGLVTGLATVGMMGAVHNGAKEKGGYCGGSSLDRMLQHEGGLPKGVNEYWATDDIYKRMKQMVSASDVSIIMPGGVGTMQELLALVVMKEHGNPIMEGKDIVIVNTIDPNTGKPYWDSMISLMGEFCAKQGLTREQSEDLLNKTFHVVPDVQAAIDLTSELKLEREKAGKQYTNGLSWADIVRYGNSDNCSKAPVMAL